MLADENSFFHMRSLVHSTTVGLYPSVVSFFSLLRARAKPHTNKPLSPLFACKIFQQQKRSKRSYTINNRKGRQDKAKRPKPKQEEERIPSKTKTQRKEDRQTEREREKASTSTCRIKWAATQAGCCIIITITISTTIINNNTNTNTIINHQYRHHLCKVTVWYVVSTRQGA